jgi:hypothetical protein
MGRLRLSERRLLRVLDALVEKGFARPLHRDNRGTLWRVALPREAFGEPVGDDVLLGRAAPAAVDAAPPDGHSRRAKGKAVLAAAPAAPTAPAAGPAVTTAAPTAAGRGQAHGGQRERELARALCRARDLEGDAPFAAALREVRELVDEGQSGARIAAAIAAVARRRAGQAERRQA